jgi:hypothetical protein
MTDLARGNSAHVLCKCIVDLISKVQRPWLFKVTVYGLPPHAHTRVYEIAARSDNDAALRGMREFEYEMSRPVKIMTDAGILFQPKEGRVLE